MQKSIDLVRQLVNDFKTHEAKYLASDYQEQEARKDFIDKFLIALGWDVNHEHQKNPYEQEVKIEQSVKTGKSQRRADYAFFIGSNFRDPKFFIEAKKPSRSLANPDDYYQIIRYAYNKKIPISVLTDFEELHVIDCRFMPDMATALDRRIASYHYSEYADEEKFSLIYHLFGREAVAAGSIEKRAAELPKPKGKGAQVRYKGGFLPIDEAFLEKLDGMRLTLAKSFKKHNQELESEELTEAVQRTIDRLVFIRFLEDKNIEEPHIANLTQAPPPSKGGGRGVVRGEVWKSFVALCKSLEPKYNGLVFKHHSLIDENKFVPPEEEFAEICNELSDVNSVYLFDEIPISILGSIYERFLGKVVHATPKRADVEDKPEVRKAGGVYYTPEYIVRYIVQNTVGKLIEGKTPEEISQMAFADIACGSGSFLIEVYSELLDYHTRYYSAHPEKAKPGDTQMREGKVVLSLKKRQEILTHNIYGVDIDYQATEVTQLSLYLKLLEDVTMNDAYQFGLIKEKILPDLRNNIVCGNSLIGTDILEGDLFEKTEERKLNPMNFEDAFPKVMRRGGFDAIVGNPPYVRQEGLGEFKEYFSNVYKVYDSAADLYTYFIEKGVLLLRKEGIFGIIVSNKWMRANYGNPLRKWLKGQCIIELSDFTHIQVFAGATTYPCILRIKKASPTLLFKVTVIEDEGFSSLDEYIASNSFGVEFKNLSDNGWILAKKEKVSLINKLKRGSVTLRSYIGEKIYYGVKTGLNSAFVVDETTKKNLTVGDENIKQLFKPYLEGKDISRYSHLTSTKYLIFIPNGWTRANSKGSNDPWKWFKKNFSAIADYLKEFESAARKRYDQGEFWWELRSCDYYDKFIQTKICWGNLSNQAPFTIDNDRHFVNAPACILPTRDLYLLGCINSKLLWWYLKDISAERAGGFIEAKPVYVEQLPIIKIDLSNPSDKSRHDHIVKLVEQMLGTKEKLSEAKLESEKDRLELLCASLDRQIDEAVYQLYGLTAEEIKVVEGER